MILNIFNIICLIGGFALYGGYLLLDDKRPEDTAEDVHIDALWHLFGGIVFFLIAFTFYRFMGWKYALFSIAVAWFLYAGIVQLIGLQKNFFFVGTTAMTDKALQSVAKIIHANVYVLAGILKILFLAFTLYLILHG